ncbi:hypothetical protein ABT030_46685 [Streptomyces mirabilis]|uniref:hypothetical protein n=1 Tax=Streptomyces mirabilis TaxID=68239 RepID=UPI00331F8611
MAQMPIARPFSLDGLISGIETARSRRINLVAIPDQLLAHTTVCGLRLQDAPVDRILQVQGTTASHRLRIVLHEPAHMRCDNVNEAGFEQLAPTPVGLPSAPRRLTGRAGSWSAATRTPTPKCWPTICTALDTSPS